MENGWLAHSRQSRSLSFKTHRISMHTKQLNFSEYSERQLRKRSMCVCVCMFEVFTLLLNPPWLSECEIIWKWREFKIMARAMAMATTTTTANLFLPVEHELLCCWKCFCGKMFWFVMRLCDQCVSQSRSRTFIANVFAAMNVDICVRMSESSKTHFNAHTHSAKYWLFECEWRQRTATAAKVFIVKYSSLNVRATIEMRTLIQNFLDEISFSRCHSRTLSHWTESRRRWCHALGGRLRLWYCDNFVKIKDEREKKK